MQTLDAVLAEAADPFGDRLRRGVEPTRHSSLAETALHNSANHLLSTFRRQTSILVSVHSGLRESLRFGNISVPAPDRMDNLLKVHI